ncbi:MAG TPA: hypothetical protein VH394_00215 [Thermoanaerobaculia bacterium]|nr:hypothetical protein [Thermoanaerobaculia bacterium]
MTEDLLLPTTEPRIRFSFWHPEHGRIDSSAFAADPMLWLRFCFLDPYGAWESGLSIDSDGKPWNSAATAENLWPWFESAPDLLAGKERIFVWAWEECNTILSLLSGNRILLEDAPFLPAVRFPLRRFFEELAFAGQQIESFDAAISQCIEQLVHDGGLESPTVRRWLESIPDDLLQEHHAPAGLLVEIRGRTAAARWQDVLDGNDARHEIQSIRDGLKRIRAWLAES